MFDNPLVRKLIEEILDSGNSAEEVCRDTPELLPQVLAGWRRFQAIEAEIDVLFPEPGPAENPNTAPPSDGLPCVRGYDLIDVLGRGGVGVVYKAVHLSLNRTVALKMLLAGAFASWAERQRFSREAGVVAGLRHPNIVQIYDVGDLDGRPYFTMEFVEGGSLAELVSGTPRPAHQAAELVMTLAGAMEAAHRGGIVHRDLKPSNVLLTADGTPKISDFGLARRLELGPSLTRTGVAVGTPSYMAPEQALGKSSETGPASDLYALGAVLYELLTGRPPFRAESAVETIYQVTTQDPVPPSRLNARVPRDLETICLKCLRKDPLLRYADAAALAEDLRRFLCGEAIAARPENWSQRLTRRVRRRPVFSASITAGTLLALTLAGGGLWLIAEREAAARAMKADRAATERAADDDLNEMARLLKKSSWPEARAALERAKGRLGDRGSANLRRRLDQGIRELESVVRLDEILLRRSANVVTEIDIPQLDQEYEAALHEAGVGRVREAPEVVAARVNASNIRGVLMAALDDWAVCTADAHRREWLLAVARGADKDLSGWRDRARDPANWKDRKAFDEVVKDAPVAEPCVPLLLALERHLVVTGRDSMPFLIRIHRAHPSNYWVNLRLGVMTSHKGDFAESVRYFQAAVALRPETPMSYNYLASVLGRIGRIDEAVEHYRLAAELEPRDVVISYNLARGLRIQGRFDEATHKVRSALGQHPEAALLHTALGEISDAKGRHNEAVAHYEKAVELDPKLRIAHTRLRGLLTRMNRMEDARAAWQAALKADPPEHEEWYGYAELCLFLGLEEEYRRARQSLLAKFGDSTTPYLAERTARACLLRPASEAELRRIVTLGERAWAVDRSKYGETYIHFLFVQGLAEYREGHLDRAIGLMRGEASRVLGPAPRLVLAMALHQIGRAGEARKTLASAILSHDWRASRARNQDSWIFNALRREAEAMILPNLPLFLEGKHQPRDNDERLAMLGACQFMGRPGSLARLYAEAFAADPRLADELRAGHRYHAARAAALAGLGHGADVSGLDELERTRWREQARRWLRADLAAYNKALDDPATDPASVQLALTNWRAEPDLAGLREPPELNNLSADERKDCLALWADVRGVNERAGRVK